MNGVDGWMDERMLILDVVSHLHQLMTWSSGISLSTLGWEPWLEVERVPSEGQLCPWETLGWLVCLLVVWALPLLGQTWCYRAALPSVCPKEMASCMSPFWWFVCGESMEFQGTLQRRPSGVREAIMAWHHMPVQVPLALPPPPTTLSQKQGYPTPFLLSSSLAGLVFLMRLHIHNGWLGFIFSKDKRIWYMCPVWTALKHVIYETLRGQVHLTSSYPRTWEPSFPIPKLYLPFEHP